jgi:hypothetical protein
MRVMTVSAERDAMPSQGRLGLSVGVIGAKALIR